MKKELSEMTNQDLIILASNYNATLKKVSKLYLKSKTQREYLERRNEILEKRLQHLKEMWEDRNGCRLTFQKIDYAIKKEKKLEKAKKRKTIKFERKGVDRNGRGNNNAEDERVQS